LFNPPNKTLPRFNTTLYAHPQAGGDTLSGLLHNSCQAAQIVFVDLRRCSSNTDGRDHLITFVENRNSDTSQPDCFFFVVNRKTVRSNARQIFP